MDNTFWHDVWKNETIFFNQAEPNPRLQAHFDALQLTKGDRIFLPLCGKSIDMVWLASQQLQVVGIELSEIAVTDFFKENQIDMEKQSIGSFTRYQHNPFTLYCGDFFKLDTDLLGPVQAAYDRGGLVALPPPLRTAYAKHICSLMPAQSRLLLITVEYQEDRDNGPPFCVTDDEVKQHYDQHFQIELLEETITKVEGEPLKSRGINETMNRVYLLTRQT